MSNKSKPARFVVDSFLSSEFFNKTAQAPELIYNSGRFYQWKNGCYYETTEENIKTAFTHWAYKQKNFDNTKRNADEALHHIKTKCQVPNLTKNTFLNKTSGYYLAFQNGIVDMDQAINSFFEADVLPHTPIFFNVAQIPYSYVEKSECPIWHKIITQILPNPIDRQLLQEWIGYHFIPGLSFSKMMFFEGHGANGKSVVLLVLRLLLGAENVSSIPLSAFEPDKTFKLASTDGKLANICEEGGQVNRRVEEALKQYVNGGTFTVERKFKDPFQMNPSAKITVATNDFPQFNEKTDGIWRRILYIKFGVTINPKDQKREYLEQDFWLKSGELEGILNWALEGASRLTSNNSFTSSERKKEELLRLKMNSNSIRLWIADRFESIPNFTQPTEIILKTLKMDIESGLVPRVKYPDLFQEIESQFKNAKRPSNAIMYQGKRTRVIIGVKFNPTHSTQENTN
ncbi:DNA primase family protein [Pseudobdellovibrio exovorus]|uniref:SF3 helicase domain-containing protein n=1 Tax=Pseudobdellovibrio exovorus JSS TaxID=1184267 RepID=M4VDR3_9BACT|nr:phage/plasmid primase, P4 family [Pseudobdellovibrio exovorus]AGH96630.1 hypothetical protein A11Q_2414 [Pseudobdellovibrio exovorus JSS]